MQAVKTTQEYQEADNLITFNHTFDLKLKPNKTCYDKKFSTCYESTILQWDILIHKSLESSSWVVELWREFDRRRYPKFHRIVFKFIGKDVDGTTIESVIHTIDGKSPQYQNLFVMMSLDSFQYKTDMNSPFANSITQLIDEAKECEEEDEMILQLETTMEFQKDSFIDAKSLCGEGAPLVINMKEYYFDALTNRRRHDLKLKTADETQFLMTNKEILCIASWFFAEILKEETVEYTVEGVNTLEAIDICLTYLVTKQYKKPTQLSPQVALDITNIANDWMNDRDDVTELFDSIQRQLYEELQENYDDLDYICQVLIMADVGRFAFRCIKSCCLAIIVHYHFNDFIRAFSQGNHPLRERLNRRDMVDNSLMGEVKKAFVASKQVRCFLKFIPAQGED